LRLDPQTRLGSLGQRLVAALIHLVIRALARTWRLEMIEGGEAFEEVLSGRRPVIFCFWHNRILPAAGLLLRRVVPAGVDLTLISSPSRDGDLSAGFLRRLGARVVRGSSSRRGARALREVHQVVTRHGSSPILIPDGPKGPAYHFKAGVVDLARLTGAPVLLMGYAASRSWTIGTWDRMVLPRPFARIAIAVAPPRPVPRRLSEEEVERERAVFEGRLGALTRAAEAAVGAEDSVAASAPGAGGTPGAGGNAGGAGGR
jgi:lysophospholipid acyltransferase (LPLAT)-like uncharacterized protein